MNTVEKFNEWNGRRTVLCSSTRPLTTSALSVNEERCGERSLRQADVSG